MPDLKHYVIRGGVQGRERLKLLSRVMHESTAALLDRAGIEEGMTCLDIGCGSGDVTIELARRVGPTGKAVGADIDSTKLDLCRADAQSLDITNVEYRTIDVREHPASGEFDVVHARFLLTHLNDPEAAVEAFYHHLKPGGRVIVQDIDFTGHFVYPESRAFRRFHELYCTAVRKRGGDPDIGPRLPLLLKQRGFADVKVIVTQPVGFEGEVKLLNALTMENIADAVLEDQLATRDEIDETVRELYEYAADEMTIAGAPRIVQAWGRKFGG
jgi:SAM-dependent methyltransferase